MMKFKCILCVCSHTHVPLDTKNYSISIGDVAKHKSLLARCMENIRGNKERIATLMQERDLATTQLQEKIRHIEILKVCPHLVSRK